MDFKKEVINMVEKATKLKNTEIESTLEKPPAIEFGDYAFPCYSLAKEYKKNPKIIAEELLKKIKPNKKINKIETKDAYLNFFINKELQNREVITRILKEQKKYGHTKNKKSVVLVESPGPNTNKPLHIGHLRNILLGSTITNILKSQGKEVHTVNVVNDRGIHICKSMLAYKKFGNEKTPEKTNKKPDHFVGDYYVKYSQEAKKNPSLEKEIQEMLIKWEQGDKETIKLWKKMNSWALKGFAQTYNKIGFKIEKEYFESETYKQGKEIILKGLKKGVFEKNEEGAIIYDLEDKGLGKKILLRPNGTSVYITQDIYMAKKRYEDYKFNEMIYVVGNEQEYHFKVLFEVFKALNWKFADKCYHFSYGLVELPEGKMKSREGTIVDTDDLLIEVEEIAKKEIKKRYKNLSEKEITKRTNIITTGAIKFFFLKFDPERNFVYNPKESLSFEGETGPYIQYSHARISSILKKAGKDFETIDYSTLKSPEEIKIINKLKEYPEIIKTAAEKMKPSLITRHLQDLAQDFNEFYHKHPVLKAEEKTKGARIALILAVKQVIKNGLKILGIEAPEEM